MPVNYFGRTIALFTVPSADQHPPEALVNWLNDLDQDWEGNDTGILFFQNEGGMPCDAYHIHAPGAQVMAVREDSTAKWRFIAVAPPPLNSV